MLYDLFISHASEDKGTFVRALARSLVEEHLTVWYDEYELRMGDSLRRSIDHGLAESRFGVVVLSNAFFAKNWPQYELDGLVTRENLYGESAILPVWHGVDAETVAQFSLPLAGRVAISSDRGLEAVVAAILQVVRPKASPLVLAKRELEAWGVSAPILTDEYWLDVVEASNRVPATGAVIPQESHWGRWGFPLPPLDGTAEGRGFRLAWAALQLRWIDDADSNGIDLTSEPSAVHAFLDRHPALSAACREIPGLLAEYAPQLTIPGMGREFEAIFQAEFDRSVTSRSTSARSELCDEEWMFLHPTFAGYSDYEVAHNWFSGGMFGPPVQLFDDVDYLFWLLSSASGWVPQHILRALKTGMSEASNKWLWFAGRVQRGMSATTPGRGALSDEFFRAREARRKDLRWTPSVWEDLLAQAGESAETLNLPESPEELASAFRAFGVVIHALTFERAMRAARRGNRVTATSKTPATDGA